MGSITNTWSGEMQEPTIKQHFATTHKKYHMKGNFTGNNKGSLLHVS